MSTFGDEPASPQLGLLRQGLTRRELFAAMAMQGLCANSGFNRKTIEEESIDCADALIAELAKEPDDAEPT